MVHLRELLIVIDLFSKKDASAHLSNEVLAEHQHVQLCSLFELGVVDRQELNYMLVINEGGELWSRKIRLVVLDSQIVPFLWLKFKVLFAYQNSVAVSC